MQLAHLEELFSKNRAWAAVQPQTVYGWGYDLQHGLIRDLKISVTSASPQ